jgi:predicted MFS family arabinose efflux permease
MKIQSLHPITIVVLIATMPLAAASLDMFLPALPAMVKEFCTTETTIHVSLSLNIVASAIFGFFSGVLSDHFGRRRLFISAMFGFTLATYFCSLVTDVVFFTMARTLQGAASGVIFVMVTTILSDVYTGVKKAQVLGIATFLFPVALGIAPFMGEKVYRHFGWPAVFICLAVVLLGVSIILFFTLPETKEKETSSLSFLNIFNDAKTILTKPAFFVNALIPSVFMGAFMAFIAYSPFIYINYFGLEPASYVYYFITPLLFQFIAGIAYQGIVKVLGINKTLWCGIVSAFCALMVMSGIFMGILSSNPFNTMIVMLFYNSAIPFVLPTVMAKTFETFPTKAGTVSSLASVIRNMAMAAYIYTAGCVFNQTPFPILGVLSAGIILFIVLSLISLKISKRTSVA